MISSKPLVIIVILNWNGIAGTLACLESVYATRDSNFRVIVIDNNSVNNELSIIEQRFPEIIPIQSQTNLGFTGGNNLGIKYALQNGAQYIWLLNNDAIVLPNTLSSLINHLEEDPKLGMISPIIIDKNPESSYYGSYIDPISLKLEDSKSPEEFLSSWGKNWKNACLWATALFIRTKSIERLGYLDDRFFAYFEDTDYSLRMNKEGWRISICPSAFVEHNNQRPDRPLHYFYYMTRNEYLLIKKHSLPQNKKRNNVFWFSRYIRHAADFRFFGEEQKSEAILDGIWNAVSHQFGPFQNKRSMPLLIKKLLMWHPYLFTRLISSR